MGKVAVSITLTDAERRELESLSVASGEVVEIPRGIAV